jgi:hypothetical protein
LANGAEGTGGREEFEFEFELVVGEEGLGVYVAVDVDEMDEWEECVFKLVGAAD